MSARLSFLPPGGTNISYQSISILRKNPLNAFIIITIYVTLLLVGIPLNTKNAKHIQDYLGGFIVAVSLLSYLFHFHDNQYPTLLQKLGTFLLGEIIVLFSGATAYWYHTGVGWEHSIHPFVIGNVIKIVTAVIMTTVF